MMKNVLAAVLLAAMVLGMGIAAQTYAQGDAPTPTASAPGGGGGGATPPPQPGLWQIMYSSGPVGLLIWASLFICSIIMGALAVDSFRTINRKKVCPISLEEEVRQAMAVGDLVKAQKACESSNTPLSRILSAGFAQVEEGFEVIQDTVGVAADMEVEKMLQRVSYLNVVANVGPMLGLTGTVQGMIMAFVTLATTQAGAAQQSVLALNIGTGLWTTLVGLLQTVPAMIFYQFFKNRANTMALMMEQITMESIKVLRTAEVVKE